MKKKILLILLILIFIVCYSLNNNEYNYVENFIEAKVVVPKNIYIFLEDNQMSIKNSAALIVNTSTEWKINIITKNTIKNYVNNKNLELYKNFKNKDLKDLVSLETLYNKGGIYVEPEILVNNGNYLIKYINDLYFKEYDCCLLEFSNSINNIKSWIYIAPKNSLFIKKLQNTLFNKYKEGGDLNKINYDVIKNLLEDYMFSFIQKNELNNIFYGITLSKSYKNFKSGQYIENYFRKPPIFA